MTEGSVSSNKERLFDWRKVHEKVRGLAKRRAAMDHENGVWLLRAFRIRVHVRLGYGSFAEYVDRLFGYSARTVMEMLRVAEALEALPRLDAALRSGVLNWSVVRELTRVADPTTEQEWLEVAQGRTVREVEKLVSGRRPGDRPSTPPDEQARRHVLRYEVAADTVALVRDALTKLVRDAGHHLSDDEALQEMARRVLAGVRPGVETSGSDEESAGRANYQIALTVCERCGQGVQHGGGEDVVVSAPVVEMAHCDAQHVGNVSPVVERVPGAHVGDRSTSKCGDAPQAPAREAAHVGGRSSGAGTDGGAHVGTDAAQIDHDSGGASLKAARPRATQTIPPATRRQVVRRDGQRCVVAGCRNHAFVDVHHLIRRSEGGDHDADNLVVLCGTHHRAVHEGSLKIEGRPSTGLRFGHADGTTYGRTVRPKTADLFTRAFGLLRSMGFKEKETRALLAAVQDHAHVGADAEPTLGDIVRQALRGASVPGAVGAAGVGLRESCARYVRLRAA